MTTQTAAQPTIIYRTAAGGVRDARYALAALTEGKLTTSEAAAICAKMIFNRQGKSTPAYLHAYVAELAAGAAVRGWYRP